MKNKISFGIITVAPNEYVVHTRLGGVKNQGLGKTFFFIPFIDSYIKFSITPHKINFFADNITTEKQGVGIDGFLIWSIDDGNKAYKKINTCDSEAMDNLSQQLIDISVSIARHAISNMPLDEVLTNREVLVERLFSQMNQLINDWGIKIEAIEIKEIRVLSEKLFENLQAPFRNQKLQLAEHSRLEAHKSIENTATDTEVSIRIRKAEQELEAKKIEIENQDRQKKLEHNARLQEEERGYIENIKREEFLKETEIQKKEMEKQKALFEKEIITEIENSKRIIIEEQLKTSKMNIELSAEKDIIEVENIIKIKEAELSYLKGERDAEITYKNDLNKISNELTTEALMRSLFEEMSKSMKNMNFDNINWYSMGNDSPMSTFPKIIVEIASTLQGLGIIKPDMLKSLKQSEA